MEKKINEIFKTNIPPKNPFNLQAAYINPFEPIKLSKSLDEFNLKIKNDLNFRCEISLKKKIMKKAHTNNKKNLCVTFSISSELAMAYIKKP